MTEGDTKKGCHGWMIGRKTNTCGMRADILQPQRCLTMNEEAKDSYTFGFLRDETYDFICHPGYYKLVQCGSIGVCNA
jgi:hypothetical protein